MGLSEVEELTTQYKGELRQLLPERCSNCYHALSACSGLAGRLALKGVEAKFVAVTFVANFDNCSGLEVRPVQLGCDTVEKKICTNADFSGQSPSHAEETVWQNIGLVYTND